MAEKKYNVQNLQPVRSKAEARERGSKGDKRSVEVRRQRKKAKECMEMILSLDAKGDNSKRLMSNLGIKDKDQQNIMLLMSTLFMKAATTGEPNAVKSVLEIVGEMEERQSNGNEKPTININVMPATEKDNIDD